MTRSSLGSRTAACAGLVALGLVACSQSPPPAPAAAEPKGPPPAPTLDQVRAATVSGVLDQPVTLVNGVYAGPPVEPGAATHPSLTLWSPAVVFSDVDGKPGSEAIAMMAADTGGSGEFVHVGVFALKDGKAASLATALVGDRVKLHKLWVEHGQIHMDVIEAGPKDPACCPTQLTRKVYALEGGALKQVSSDVVGSLSVNLLAGIDWMLSEMDGQPVDASGKPPTLLVQYGKVVGFGGCNRYTGSLKESAPGKISIGPLAATKMACPPAAMELEDKFTERMNKVTGYTFVAGQLALGWEDKQGGGMLVFSK
jgi:heat shock protein HslJ